MSRLWARVAGMFSQRTMAGVDKSGNRYFVRKEEIDGVMKEKRWVIFKGEEDPTSIPVEWICWLNGQRKKAPTPEEMEELETRREIVKLNVARLKQEEEERRAKEGSSRLATSSKVGGPDLKSFIKQFPAPSEGERVGEPSNVAVDTSNSKVASLRLEGHRNEMRKHHLCKQVKRRTGDESETEKNIPHKPTQQPGSSEPAGSGESFRPGTWQPPM